MIKIGNVSFNLQAVEGKTLDELIEKFPRIRIEVIKALHKQVGIKAKKVKKLEPTVE